MRRRKHSSAILAAGGLCVILAGATACGNRPVDAAPRQSGDAALVERLARSQAVNMDAVMTTLGLLRVAGRDAQRPHRGFDLLNPYEPAHRSPAGAGETRPDVIEWYEGYETDRRVCAVKFESSAAYRLQTFADLASAEQAGYVLTHHKPCGACSSLEDLAVYLARPDLVSPARHCARKTGLGRIKACFEESLGFTPYCAEIWAYNASHTKRRCAGTCMATYGLFNVLAGHFDDTPNNDPDGLPNACIQCDEVHSGAGFKYGAGRTRRNSGIVSAIDRRDEEIRHVDHAKYFTDR